MITHTIDQFTLNPKSKQDKVINLKKLLKFQIFQFWKKTLHATQFLKLLDKMCKFEMDTANIVEDTEQTRFCPQTDRRKDKVNPVYSFQLRWEGGIIIVNTEISLWGIFFFLSLHSKLKWGYCNQRQFCWLVQCSFLLMRKELTASCQRWRGEEQRWRWTPPYRQPSVE